MNDSTFIYILLTDTGTLFTRLIKLFTRAPMNHASLALDRELEEVYSFGRKNQRNPLSCGFVKEDMTSTLFGRATCALFSCEVNRDTYEKIRLRIQEFQENEQRYKYNLIGLFGVLVNKSINRKYAYFCTQFVATVLEDNGIQLSSKSSALVTPGDIERAQALRPLYQGSLNQYMNELQSA